MGYIHKEGYATIALVSFVSLALMASVYFFYPDSAFLQVFAITLALILLLIVLQFFRNPNRIPDSDMHHTAVIAPADGKVVVIEETEEPEYLQGRALQVSIFMSPVNVHVNRAPVSGQVSYYKYHPGKYLVAWHPKSSTENERTSLAIRTENGSQVFLRQIAGALARRIVCYARPGNQLSAAQEFGFIKFGSRVDVFLPLGTEINVKLGDKTIGGRTVLAHLPD